MRFSHCGRSISGRGYSGRTFSGSTLSAQTVLILSPAGFHWANPAEAAANAAIRSAIFFICIIFRFGRGGKLRRCALFETWFQVSCKARRLSTVFLTNFPEARHGAEICGSQTGKRGAAENCEVCRNFTAVFGAHFCGTLPAARQFALAGRLRRRTPKIGNMRGVRDFVICANRIFSFAKRPRLHCGLSFGSARF